jgi:hypothetical protein
MTIIVSDTFTADDGTNLSAHTPDIDIPAYGNWSVGDIYSGGTPVINDIQGNKARIGYNDGTGDYIYRSVGVADYTITLKWTTGGYDSRFGIIVRDDGSGSHGSGNHYMAAMRAGAINDLRFVRVDLFSETVLYGPTAYSFNTSTTYTVKLVCSGENFSFYIDDAHQYDVVSNTYLSQQVVGVARFLGIEEIIIDDFSVDDGINGHPAGLSGILVPGMRQWYPRGIRS